MTVDLNAIIDSLKPIAEYDLDGVEPTFHPIGDLSNVMREDEESSSFTRKWRWRTRRSSRTAAF